MKDFTARFRLKYSQWYKFQKICDKHLLVPSEVLRDLLENWIASNSSKQKRVKPK